MRTCSLCHQDFPKEGYPHHSSRCFACKKQKDAERTKAYRARVACRSERTCSSCKQTLNSEAFSPSSNWCKHCTNLYQAKRSGSTPQHRLAHLVRGAKHNAKMLGVPFEITKEHLLHLWETQGGKCYYTGIDLTYSGDRGMSAASVDRKIPSLGYVEGNVVLAAWSFNRMKQNYTFNELAFLCEQYLQWFKNTKQ